MDEHTLAVLEFPDLLGHLSRCAQSEPGQARALALRPHTDPERVREELALTGEGLRLLIESPPDLSPAREAAPVLARLGIEGAVLSPAELLTLGANQRAVRDAKRSLRGRRELLPRLSAAMEGLASFPDWEEWVGSSLTEEGEVKDSASPGLAAARRSLREAKEAVTRRLSEFMAGDKAAKVVREAYVTLRNDRYVIPAKPEYHRAFKGVVQDTSASGQTVFVEPLFAVPLNNKLIEARVAEEEEIRRVLGEMTEVARAHREELAANLRLVARFDLVMARARLGGRMDAVLPVTGGEGTRLVRARHPLLALREGGACVPVDLTLAGETTALVITGPNTGGKTVALKTLGLLTLMAQSGIPVPADEGSVFGVYRQVFADIGDEQSLAQSLSTFSAHMTILARILAAADGATLVLADEMGAGTDPQEGSALGVAMLEALHARGARAAVTTHHNLLKEFAFRTPYAANASVVFDPVSLRPTYQLRMGTPGRSHALEIASHLGLPGEVIARARTLQGTGAAQVDHLIERLSTEVEREASARGEAEEIARRMGEERDRLREELARAREEAARIRKEAEREARALLRELRDKGKALVRSARAGEIADAARLAREFTALEKRVEEALPREAAEELRRRGEVRVGQAVEAPERGLAGVLARILPDGRTAEVVAGALRARVPLAELVGAEEPEEKAPRARRSSPPAPASTAYEGESGGSPELMLLGKRVEEGLEELDRFLDRHVLGGFRSLRIVHGMGTGAMRRAVREALKGDPRVAASRPGAPNEGGNGVTIAELRD